MERSATEVFIDYSQHLPIRIGHDTAREDFTNGFIGQRFNLTNLGDLARFVWAHRANGAECLPLFAALSSKPAGEFESLATVYADVHGRTREPSNGCICVIRDLFLRTVDRRLQDIYLKKFSADPFKSGMIHEQKIASLEATRHDVLTILNSYDWHWLASWLNIGRIGETAEDCVRRLANFAFSVETVFFLFTHHCNISCRHCYNNSGPHKKASRIPLDKMLAIVAQMPAAGITRLEITGGEPFLYPQDLFSIVKAGRAAGLDSIRIYSNGFWASTDARARQTLDRLAQAGFMQGRRDHIKISAGVYHQEFVQFERALTAARNYYDRFGRALVVDFELPPQRASEVADEIRKRITAAGLTEQVQLHLRPVRPHGRGEHIEGIDTFSIGSPCADIKAIMINPDQTVRPCAGLNHQNHGIAFGRSDQHDLKGLIKRMQNDPILQLLATKPMEQIFTHVAKQRKASGYTGFCDLCKDALGDLIDREAVQAKLFAQQNFYPFWFTLSPGAKNASATSSTRSQ